MRTGSATVVVLAIFVFLSFYFALLPFYTIDETQKKELVSFAVSSIMSGVILFACLTIYYIIKKGFSRMDN